MFYIRDDYKILRIVHWFINNNKKYSMFNGGEAVIK